MEGMKVVIVGAGPVGSLAALYAAARGATVEIYELRSGKLEILLLLLPRAPALFSLEMRCPCHVLGHDFLTSDEVLHHHSPGGIPSSLGLMFSSSYLTFHTYSLGLPASAMTTSVNIAPSTQGLLFPQLRH